MVEEIDDILSVVAIKKHVCRVCGVISMLHIRNGEEEEAKDAGPSCDCGVEHIVEDVMKWH